LLADHHVRLPRKSSSVQRWNRIAFDTIRFALATVIGAAGLPLTASAQENKIKLTAAAWMMDRSAPTALAVTSHSLGVT
jgi:hypothetical protein